LENNVNAKISLSIRAPLLTGWNDHQGDGMESGGSADLIFVAHRQPSRLLS